MKIIKRILQWLAFLFVHDGDIAKEAVDEGLCDFSGQGRDKYGK